MEYTKLRAFAQGAVSYHGDNCGAITEGRRGPITERLQKAFFEIVEGTGPDDWGWLTPVEKPRA